MTVEQAIEILTEWHWPDSAHPWKDKEIAIKLGIEALKAIRDYRGAEGATGWPHSHSIPSLLPKEI